MHRFTLRQLEYLLTCVDTGSVARAADMLSVSQPTISVAITKLEEQLGVQLLLRHPSRGVTPTTAADKILNSARSLLAHAADLERQTIETGSRLEGELRLGSFSTLAPAVLPGLIQSLSQRHPGIQLRLREGPQDQMVAALQTGQLDLALLYDINLPEDIHKTPLATRAPYAVLGMNDPLAQNEQVSLADLAKAPLILLDVPPSREYFLGLFRNAGMEPRIAYSTPSIEMVRGMVGCGLGYSLLVTRPKGDTTYDGNNLAIRLVSEDVEQSAMVLARLATLRPTRLMSRFEEIAVDVVR